MSARHEPARVLVAAAPLHLELLRPLFASPLLRGWHAVEADTLERMHFLDQMHPCDALVLDTTLVSEGQLQRLDAAACNPIVLLGEASAPLLQPLAPCWSWLPRMSVVQCPALLAATLRHLAEVAAMQNHHTQAQAALAGSRRRIDALVDLLWQVIPGELPGPWFSQRHMLQRCDEEVARCRRYGTPLSIVLGEVDDQGERDGEAPAPLPRWAAARLCLSKRRSDVAGQYGPRGFMLLLPSTDAAGAAACCQRLQQILATGPSGGASPAPLDLAFGIADCPTVAATVPALLRRAEVALEEARTPGATAAC
jgi:GGDEF domain-containing protein